MRKALYRQHRPKKLAQVVGQEHITTTLANAIKTGNISHAYLFTGPRGVGKTSIARILAHEINGLDYSDDQTHLDIIEIDAASNRRIDEIRDLRDKVHIAPTSAKYKVYIIDEVHMLTREAFNALLKTLEEPPAHVVFILATTEAHKVPETISSRTQRFSFRSVSDDDISKHLANIAKQEKIQIEEAALQLIASHGQGSFRDSIGLLDQLSGSGNVTLETVEKIIGVPAQGQLVKLCEALAHRDASQILEILQHFRSQGISPVVTAKNLTQLLRDQLISPSFGMPKSDIVSLIDNLLAVPTFNDQATGLEIALLKYALAGDAEIYEPQPFAEPIIERPEGPPVVDLPPQPIEDVKPPTEKPIKNTDDEKAWAQVLKEAKQAHNTLYSVLRMAQISRSKDKLELGFKFAFHVKQVTQSRNMSRLQELVANQFGGPLTIVAVVSENYSMPVSETKQDTSTPAPNNDESISNISNIFGGAELLD